MTVGREHIKWLSRKYAPIDLESLVFSILAILVARGIIFFLHHPFWYVASLLISIVPPAIISFKLVRYLEKKNVVDPESRSIKLSLFALFLIPIVYVPTTLLNYVTDSYVFVTVVLTLLVTLLGNKLEISETLLRYFDNAKNGLTTEKKSLLIFFQIALFIFISLYLNNQSTPIPPNQIDTIYLVAFGGMLAIPSYLLVTNAKLKYYSIITTAIFLFSFLLLQNLVYYGGDSGLFVSVTKYMLNGGSANFISVGDRWRFGSTAVLGLPSLSAYLSEASGLTPEIPIPFETAASIIFVTIGGIVYAEFIGKTEFEKSAIVFAFVLLQPAIYYSELNVLRSTSILLLVLPFVVPLFTQLRFNVLGKLSFFAAMFSLWIVHPLSLVIIVVMMAYFLKRIRWRERIGILSLIIIIGILLVISPSTLRSLSISPEKLPSLTFKKTILEQLATPFPDFASSAWPASFVQKVSMLITILLIFMVILLRDFPLPRFPVIGFLIAFFVLAFVVESDNFPVIRLSLFLATLGIVGTTSVSIRFLQAFTKLSKHVLRNNTVANRTIIQPIGKIAIFSLIAFLVIMSSYPRDRALTLDAYSATEYQFLKKFVTSEKQNFGQSLILSHIETLRYLNGIDGSILYYNGAPRAFSIDFTDSTSASKHYDAFSALLSGDSSKAKIWLAQHNVTSAYVVILYRFVPSGVNFSQGDSILQNDVGMVRKVHFAGSLP